MSTDVPQSFLRVGWRVDDNLQPTYWLYADDPKQGGQDDFHLFTIPASSIANHTVIIAQSGSGKSFFLGRLLEEVVLQTKARCIILDPNADFRRISDVVDGKLWSEKQPYDKTRRIGRLTNEFSKEDFQNEWAKTNKSVFGLKPKKDKTTTSLQLPWDSLSVDFLGEDVSDFAGRVAPLSRFCQDSLWSF